MVGKLEKPLVVNALKGLAQPFRIQCGLREQRAKSMLIAKSARMQNRQE
jgi:hypothetical protein